jgi:ferredoxin
MAVYGLFAMPVVRFVREAIDVPSAVGANLRELALAAGVELYGLKGRLGNCGGCGQCITCFVEVVAERGEGALSPRTGVEDQKLRRRPQAWRLACQALVMDSVAVLTRPQAGRDSLASTIEAATREPLPEGPPPPAEEPELEQELDQEELRDEL